MSVFWKDCQDDKHLPVFNGFMKVKLDCATGTMRFRLLFVLELGVLYTDDSKKKLQSRKTALKNKFPEWTDLKLKFGFSMITSI